MKAESQQRAAVEQEVARAKAEAARLQTKQVYIRELTRHVQEHLKEFIQQGQRKHFVRLIKLESTYLAAYPVWKQNEHWDVMVFRSIVCACLGNVRFKAIHSYREHGVGRAVRMVILGYTLVSREAMTDTTNTM